MVSISRLIAGLILLIGGIVLIIVSLFSQLWIIVYGIPALGIGIWMLLNKNEDKIEQRLDESKSLNKKETKK